MRPIDADVLKKDLTRFYDNEVTAKQLIDEQPTIEPQPEPAIPLSWIESHIAWLKSLDNAFASLTALQISTMVQKWKDKQDE